MLVVGQGGKKSQHQLTGNCRRVYSQIERLEDDIMLSELPYQVDQMFTAPTEAVKPGNYHRVAYPQERQNFIKCRPLRGHAGDLLFKDAVAAVTL